MRIREKIRHLLTLDVSPHSIAMGSAIGIFFGFIPVFGFKTLLSYFSSILLRVNTAAAILTVTLHDVLLPFVPVILRIEYQIGYWLISHPHHFAPKIQFHGHEHFHLTLASLRDWHRMAHIGWPIIIGSTIIAVAAAVVTYGITYGIFLVRYQRRMQKAIRRAEVGTEPAEISVSNGS